MEEKYENCDGIYEGNHHAKLHLFQILNLRSRAKPKRRYFSCGCLATEIGVFSNFLKTPKKMAQKLAMNRIKKFKTTLHSENGHWVNH